MPPSVKVGLEIYRTDTTAKSREGSASEDGVGKEGQEELAPVKGQKLRPTPGGLPISFSHRKAKVCPSGTVGGLVPRQDRGWKRNRGQQFVTCSRPGSYGRAVGNIPHRLPWRGG